MLFVHLTQKMPEAPLKMGINGHDSCIESRKMDKKHPLYYSCIFHLNQAVLTAPGQSAKTIPHQSSSLQNEMNPLQL